MTVAATLLAAYDPDDIRPGWVALGIVVALAVATFLLWRSMNTQLGRIDVPTKAELADRASLSSHESGAEGASEKSRADDDSDGEASSEHGGGPATPERGDEGNRDRRPG